MFRDNELATSVRDRTTAVGGDVGFTTSHSTEFRLGYQVSDVESSLAIGTLQPGDPGREVSGKKELARMRFTLDRMDAPIVPERGFRAEAAADYYLDVPASETAFGLASASVTIVHPLSDEDRVFGGFRGGASFENDAPLRYQFWLGGPFRLSSFDRERFQGTAVPSRHWRVSA